MAPEIRKKQEGIRQVCFEGGGPPKRPPKTKVFGNVFKYLKVALLSDYYQIIILLFLDHCTHVWGSRFPVRRYDSLDHRFFCLLHTSFFVMANHRKVCQAVGCVTKAQNGYRGYCKACLRKKFPKLYVEKHASEGTCIVCSSQEARHDLNLFRRCRSCFSKEDPYLQRKMVSASHMYLPGLRKVQHQIALHLEMRCFECATSEVKIT